MEGNSELTSVMARLDAAIRLAGPEHITPMGARIIRRAVADCFNDDTKRDI